MDTVTIVGVIASVGTGISSLPQLVKIIHEKKVEGFSFIMLAILCVGLSFWIIYGILKEDWILIASNGFSLLVNLAIAILGMKYKKS